jgi:hypothetical protein
MVELFVQSTHGILSPYNSARAAMAARTLSTSLPEEGVGRITMVVGTIRPFILIFRNSRLPSTVVHNYSFVNANVSLNLNLFLVGHNIVLDRIIWT